MFPSVCNYAWFSFYTAYTNSMDYTLFFRLWLCYTALQCFASWLSMCKVEMALINISGSN